MVKRHLAFLSLLTFISVFLVYGCGPSEDLVAFEAAEKSLVEGDFEGALLRYSVVVENFSDSPYGVKSQYMIGYIYSNHLRDMNNARKAWAMLYSLYPMSEEVTLARESMGEMYSRSGEHRKAIAEYDWLMERGDENERDRYQYRIANEYIGMNDFAQARIEFQEIIASAPDTDLLADVHYGTAITYYFEGNLSEAIALYDKIAFDFPDHRLALEARLSKASALAESGELDAALELLARLADEYSNSEVVNIRISSAQEMIK